MNFCNEVKQIKVSNRLHIKITDNKLKERDFNIISNTPTCNKFPTLNETKKKKLIDENYKLIDERLKVNYIYI
jgi:hypothetical protein